jgi:crossover junction endodeoxyribonuclease RuvC
MIVLGIDPGLASTGYGLVRSRGSRLTALAGGTITTDAGMPLELRLARIAEQVESLFEQHAPGAVAIEQIYFGRNVETAFAVGQARGLVLAAAGRREIRCFSYTPQAIKSAVTGSGGADKEQVKRMVTALLDLPKPAEPDHLADALAVAICHLHVAPGRNAVELAAGR